MSTPAKDLQPDLSEPLCDAPLSPEPEFMDKMRGIFGPNGITKRELDEHIAKHPHDPEKRGRKAKRK